MKVLLYLTVFFVSFIPAHLEKVNLNQSYGNDSAQRIDIYEPENATTKAIVLIHGGAWSSGKKEDINQYVDKLKSAFPDYLIANMEYRLGNLSSPGYPKQLEDIDMAIQFLKSKTSPELKVALFGGSSGAHIAMLYSYAMNLNGTVKAVVDIVGPADFNAKGYADNPFLNLLIMNFVGPYFYKQNPAIYNITSPVTWITPSSPPTIGFYGNRDPIVPNDQVPSLQGKLIQNNVANEFYIYPGGHADWAPKYQQDLIDKTVEFLKLFF